MEGVGVVVPSARFWQGKRVLVTGHTGFKGSWLTQWLARLGASVAGVALPPMTEPNLFTLARIDKLLDGYFCDIRSRDSLFGIIKAVQPSIVFHLAAQPLVRVGYRMPVETVETNVMGTTYLLEALRAVESVRVAVLATTDKVYRNGEHSRPFREDDPLGGDDPYSASKAASELIIDCYRRSFFDERGVAIATARAGNVIGGGDWSADRLIPDAVKSWSKGEALFVRRPAAVRPWQHVLEPLCGYLRLVELLWDTPVLSGPYNFGPDSRSTVAVRGVVELARAAYGGGEIAWGDGCEGPYEAVAIALESAKAKSVLGVVPRWTIQTAIERTMTWYRRQAVGENARRLCEEDIVSYEERSA
ncbi:MAG: CDP-glucose 4,6-dehydratase [Nitrospira sp.]|nr:CDP-glucose 4,6-dehydratase [Nitrospira sp.]MCP9474886.1 CDP-glucose 4,6-dehydratase [Nitrospira sp.]